MTEIINLSKAREAKNGKEEWTALEAIGMALDAVKSGEIKPTGVACLMIDDDGNLNVCLAGLSEIEYLGLLELATQAEPA